MPNVTELIQRLVNAPDQPEANQQADIRQPLYDADLGLDPADSPIMEIATPSGGRIDVQVGATVIEVKRSLVSSGIPRWEEQLAAYVRDRQLETRQRWAGILTDGRIWRLYSIDESSIKLVGEPLDARSAPPGALVHWLGAVLATRKNIPPTPAEIQSRIGTASPTFALDLRAIADLYEANRDSPSVAVKRDLWARLLSDAFGTKFAQDPDQSQLFIRHTYLVVVAEIIAHYVLGLPATIGAREMLAGTTFSQAQIHGVVEQDFFDWVIEVEGGLELVESLIRRIAQFDFSDPEHDVLKVLYEAVIDPDTRRRLGEYYTPDWLSKAIVDAIVDNPLEQRVLDPACGSGTFLFWAIRRYLAAADQAGIPRNEALTGLTRSVSGMDLHPVAVTLARVTYLLAIGHDWLQERTELLSIPVFLADSMSWRQPERIHTAGAIVISTAADDRETGAMPLWSEDIVLDDRLLSEPGRFDGLISELADRAASSQVLGNVLRRYSVPSDLHTQVEAVFNRFCELHDNGRDHVWGYFVRNLARPRSFQLDPVDRLVGNPPWLSYRNMTEPVKSRFKEESQERGLWTGGRSASQQDLSAYFLAKAIGRFLKPEGRFGFVMPSAVLNQRQYEGFRSGE